MFSKVLIANRGEIAIRVIRALDELGIASVAVYSELDRDALHVQARRRGLPARPGPTAAESYLNVEKILEVAKESGAEAVHPGYGFLAENARLRARLRGGGDRLHRPARRARSTRWARRPGPRAHEGGRRADRARAPPTRSTRVEDARKIIDADIGYPVAVKAAGGGGGKGFRVALTEDELEGAFEGAAREGEKFFSDATVYLERYLPDPRHVEVQVLADGHGNVIHLGERDCSIQRRHQKLIEEAPAPAVDEELRERIGKIGVDAAEAVGYRGAGTIEGLLQDGEYFFLEMNTRVQVEHCVTEMVTGIDIVKEGIRAAAGEPLSLTQDEVELRGHAIECRINAEDASKNFAPAPGTIGDYREPAGPGVRVDSGVGPGGEVSPMYDPMVAKLIVWDADREQATQRMLRALARVRDRGPQDADPVPHRAARHRAVGATARPAATSSRTRSGSSSSRYDEARQAADAEDEEPKVEQRLHGRGLRPALRRQGDRRGRRRRRRRNGAAPAAGAQAAQAPRARAAVAAAAAPTSSPPRCRATCEGRSSSRAPTVEEGAAHLHHRGDEDGERDHRPQGGHDRGAADQGGRRRSPPATRSPSSSQTRRPT